MLGLPVLYFVGRGFWSMVQGELARPAVFTDARLLSSLAGEVIIAAFLVAWLARRGWVAADELGRPGAWDLVRGGGSGSARSRSVDVPAGPFLWSRLISFRPPARRRFRDCCRGGQHLPLLRSIHYSKKLSGSRMACPRFATQSACVRPYWRASPCASSFITSRDHMRSSACSL